ncbi:unnamed protein product, partial [Mesorhabditis spiculigera]
METDSIPDGLPLLDLPADVLYRILDFMPTKDVLKLRNLHSFVDHYINNERTVFDFFAMSIMRRPVDELSRMSENITRLSIDGRSQTWKQFEKLACGHRNTIYVNLLVLTAKRVAIQIGDEFLKMADRGAFRAKVIHIYDTRLDAKVQTMIKNSRAEIINMTNVAGSTNDFLPVPETCHRLSIYWAVPGGVPADVPNRRRVGVYRPVVDLTEATGLKEVIIDKHPRQTLVAGSTVTLLNDLRTGHRAQNALENLRLRFTARYWTFEETATRYYLLHESVSFFIRKSEA